MDLNKLGLLAIKNGDFQKAANIFRRALDKEKNSTGFYRIGKGFFLHGGLPRCKVGFLQSAGHGAAK
jgi:hypothetical protein